MNDETTRLLNEGQMMEDNKSTVEQPINTASATPAPAGKNKRKNSSSFRAAGAGVGGFAAGVIAGTTLSGSAEEAPDPKANHEEDVDAPNPEQAILANDEGIRYAHVEAESFEDAFAQARAQVGPGGVFEYNGNLYGTYTAQEWDNMSAEERAEYQHRVNELPTPESSDSVVEDGHHDVEVVSGSVEPVAVNNVENAGGNVIDVVEVEQHNAYPSDSIHVIGVDYISGPDNTPMGVAVIETGGEQIGLVDIDNDGKIDVALIDNDGNGVISENEVYQAPDGIYMEDIQAMQNASSGTYMASYDDGMPDYANDADIIMDA